MGAEAEATVRLGLEGEEEVVKGAERIDLTYGRMGERLKSAVGGAVREVGRGFAQLVQDAARVATAMQTMSLGQAVEQAKALEYQYTRAGVAGRRSMEEVKKEIRETSKYTLTDDATTERLIRGYGKLTYNLKGAKADIRALAAEGSASGRDLEEELSLGKVLRQDMGVTGDLGLALGKLRAQAEQLGTVGGPEALGDMLQRLGPQLSQVSLKTDEARGRMTAFLGELGKGRNAEAGARLGSSVLGAVQGNWQAVERTLGRRVRDKETGQIENSDQIAVELRDKLIKSRGARRAELAMANLFGPEAAAQMMHLDAEKVRQAAKAQPSQAAASAHAALRASDAGRRAERKIGLDQRTEDAVKPLVETQDWFDELIQSPYLRWATGGLGSSAVVGWTAGKLAAGKAAAKGAAGKVASAAGDMVPHLSRTVGRAGGAILDAEEQAAQVLMKYGPGGIAKGALRTGWRAASVPLQAIAGGYEIAYRGIDSLGKDSEFAQGRRAALSRALGRELAGQAEREGRITPEIYGRARGDQDAIQELIRILAEVRDRLPPDLAAQIGAATSDKMATKTLKVAAAGGSSKSQRDTDDDKTTGEGRT